MGGATESGGVTEKAHEAADAAATVVKERSTELTTTAKNKVGKVVDERRDRLVSSARDVQTSAKDLADKVRDDQPQIADMIEQAAERASTLVEYVEQTQVSDIMTDAVTKARQRPWIVAAGMFGAGFLLARAARPVTTPSTTPQRQLTTGSGIR